ncbi:peptidyl-prolyl cis-trans isomerase D [Chromohalobacter marismortui]|uniref:Periplasmic chaperone PpiD n=1 Tax=Chromohalobacter marismortui TaxID=42055 RepID=A0A4R7NQS4_9GAMM|nr:MULTISPECIES: SurA N-terminal domain-containing protein [Chromohalobacter]MCI0508773.1 SurA N-terminal domain-containing protein [Chromohalobacter sp.]MCI0594582.1 SurA N-terminal domain-containing protein [Chromohalobacter sp.]TDU22861.1 peptidyl-prolyl cis-trans isomerase D [Chromohalobacter marismortui]
MLQRIREGSQGWAAKVIVGAIIVTFALFGAESLVGVFTSGSNDAATVNGESIGKRAVELQVQRAIRSGQVPPDQERELRKEVLDRLITTKLLDQYADEGGMHLSDAQIDQLIVSRPVFQDSQGNFSQEIFTNRLAQAGYTPLSFRHELRRDMKRQQLQQGLALSTFVLPGEANRLQALQNQTRDFRYAVLTPTDLQAPVEVSQEDLKAYYDAHRDQYQRPEQVKVAYVVLNQQQVAQDIEVDEQQLRDAYAQQRQDAPREVAHIMVDYGEERTREEAMARIKEAQRKLDEGKDFASVAAEYSDDATSADEGGDLGVIKRGFFGDAFDNAAFSLKEGEVSSIVDGGDGLHLIKVTNIEFPSFDEQRDQLAEQVRLDNSSDAFNQRVQALEDQSYAAEDLQSVADDLGLNVRTSGWVSRDSAQGLLAEPGVMDAVFSTDVLENGYNSDVLELDAQRRAVVRVVDHRQATSLPLDEVKKQVRAAVKEAKTREALEARAQELLASLQSGTSVSLDWQKVEGITRDGDSAPDSVLRQAFRLPHPGEGSSFGQAPTENGVAVIELTSVHEGDTSAASSSAPMVQRLRAQAVIQGLIETLRERADIQRL